VSAVVTQGVPRQVPEGYVAHDRELTRAGMLRPLDGALASMRLTLVLLWCVAALVIGSVVYLSAIERARDFAVYKATGWSTLALAGGLALQSVLLSVLASAVGIGLAALLVPLFPLTFDVPTGSQVLLPVVAAGVGLAASLAGLRRAVGIEPAVAFGGQ
jgi:putative ABC transport system permease protein